MERFLLSLLFTTYFLPISVQCYCLIFDKITNNMLLISLLPRTDTPSATIIAETKVKKLSYRLIRNDNLVT